MQAAAEAAARLEAAEDEDFYIAEAEAQAEVLTKGGQRRLLLVAARVIDPVLNNARTTPPPPDVGAPFANS